MRITLAEFCQFNKRSRLKLLNKDGIYLAQRKVFDKYIVKLYKAYGYYIEVVLSQLDESVVRVDPMPNDDIVDMYLDGITLNLTG